MYPIDINKYAFLYTFISTPFSHYICVCSFICKQYWYFHCLQCRNLLYYSMTLLTCRRILRNYYIIPFATFNMISSQHSTFFQSVLWRFHCYNYTSWSLAHIQLKHISVKITLTNFTMWIHLPSFRNNLYNIIT